MPTPFRVAALVAGAVTAASGTAFATGPSRTFVASTGSDANAPAGCPRSAPCRGFQAALDAVADGGEVVALDSAGYGPMNIVKPVTVTSEGVHASITAASGAAVAVTAPLGAVTLRNLRLVGGGAGTSGVEAEGVGRLYLENLVVSGLETGIRVRSADVFIREVAVNRASGGAIVVRNATVVVERARMENGGPGLDVSEGGTAVVRDSTATGNSVGFTASWISDPLVTFVDVEACVVADNAVGIRATGDVQVRVSDSRIDGNGMGLATDQGGHLESFGDNKLAGNGVDGSFTATGGQQ